MKTSLRLLGVLIVAAFLSAVPASFAQESTVELPGHVPPQNKASTRLDRVASNETIHLSLVVKIDQQLAEATLRQIYGPNAPAKRQFLTPAQFAQKFDLASKRAALKQFASSHGLSVDIDEPNSLVVRVSGPASSVENAFGVQLYHYQHSSGQIFRSHDTEPLIPASLVPHLNAVLGLSDFRGAAKPHIRRAPGKVSAARPAATPGSPKLTGATGTSGGLAPADIKTIYGLSGSLNGSGQIAAVYELDGYVNSDIALYATTYHLSFPTPTFVGVDGQTNLCGANQNCPCNANTYNGTGGTRACRSANGDGGMAEVALDIELLLALAPSVSQLRVYEAPNTTQGGIDNYAQIANDDTASVISTSWGLDQEDAGSSTLTSEQTIFQQMAMQGQTILSAAGDDGAYDAVGLTPPDPVSEQNMLMVDDPASQPLVIGVGGTSISGSVSHPSESVWNNGCSSSNPSGTCGSGAGGGGIADFSSGGNVYWSIPSYQVGIAGESSTSARNVPDVALNADPNSSPYDICVAGSCVNQLFGGTSCAAPLWAGLLTLVNQQLGSGSLGFITPILYSYASGAYYNSLFNDIKSGNNGFYAAGTGYDNASGWGSFKANALISALSGPPPAPTASAFSNVSFNSLQANWTDASAAPGTSYTAIVSTGTFPNSFAGNVSSTTFNTFAAFSGLNPSTFYFAEVEAVNSTGTASGFTVLGSTETSSGPSAPIAAAFSGVTTSAIKANWTPNGASAGTTYSAILSTGAFPNSFAGNLSSSTANSFATFSGLSVNTTYFAEVQAVSSLGPTSAFTALGSTSTLANVPIAAAFSNDAQTSVQANWIANGNPGGTSYLAFLSTGTFPNTFSGNISSRTANTSVDFAGLQAATTYFAEVEALNHDGVATSFAALGSTRTFSLVAPPAPGASPFSGWTATGLQANWTPNGAPAGTTYAAILSTGAFPNSFAGNISSATANVFASFAGLSVNTTYYAEVEAINSTGTASGFTSLSWTSTLANVPAAAAFSNDTQSSVQANWTANGDPSGTTYVAILSTGAFPNSFAGNISSTTANVSVDFTGLQFSTTYFAEVEAIDRAGTATAFATLGSTVTSSPPPPPAPGAAAFSGFTTSALQANWTPNGAPAGTTYTAILSTGAFPNSFAGNISSSTANVFASYTGLSVNTTYFAEVEAISSSDVASGFTSLGWTSTLANAPAAAAFTSVLLSSLQANWTAGGNPNGTAYVAIVSTGAFPNSFAGNVSSTTANTSVDFTGLQVTTTYFAEVEALDHAGTATAFVTLGSTETLSPGPPGVTPSTAAFALAGISSTTVQFNWTSSQAGPYLAQISANSSFSPVLASSVTANSDAIFGLSSALTPNGLYFMRVSSMTIGAGPWSATASTATFATPPTGLALSQVTNQSVDLSWISANSAGTNYQVQYWQATGSTTTLATTQTSLIIGGLTNATTYFFTVGASGVNGFAEPSGIVVSSVTALVAVVASPAAAVGLKAALVYPDPVIPPYSPVIRVCPGIVDSIEVTIFDIAGRVVNSSGSFAGPMIPAAGEGAGFYCYEYTWTGRIPSGVYFAVVHAHGSGDTVKARMKFAVVR